MKRTTLSFLTESKASHVSLSSFRRVAITLLVMLLTTASAWAQFPTPTIYYLYLNENYQGGGGIGTSTVEVPISEPTTTYTLTSYDEPTRAGYMFCGWSTSSTGAVKYRTNDQITLTGNLTLYAVWDDNPYIITLNTNYDAGVFKSILVPRNHPNYTLTSRDEPTRTGCTFYGWSDLPTGVVKYKTGDPVELTGNLTLYAIWEDTTPYVSGLKYSITDEVNRQVKVTGYEEYPTGTLNIPATVTINGTKYSVTSIGDDAFFYCTDLQSVTIPNSVTTIGDDAFAGCSSLQSVTINGNPKIGDDAFGGTLATVTMNLTASEIDGDYWTTFYNYNYAYDDYGYGYGYNFQADENTKVYKGTVEGSSLVLTEVEDRIVNSGTAVILKSTGNPVMTLTELGSSDSNGNDLQGISDRDLRTSVISDFNANEIYTMGNTSVGFGFHRYTGEYVPAQKAFLPLNTSDGAKAQSLTIVYAIGATGINSVSPDSNVQNDWFSLDGTRLNGKPSQPGIYVNGKKKIVIK